MSLDLFAPAIAASDQNVAQNAAAHLPAEFGESFDVAWRSGTESNNSAAYSIARERALVDYNDDVYQKTGERLPWLGVGPEDASLDQFNEAQAKLQQKVPGLDYLTPLSEGDINAMALRRMAKAHAASAAFSNRETTWGGTAGTVLGTLAGGLADPVMLATAPLGGAGEAGIALRALEFAGISGGSTAASAGIGYGSREAAVPGSAKEIPGEILGATLSGAVLGGAFGLLGKLLGAGAKTLPTSVRDEVNAATSEFQFHATNPFPTAAGETAARDATVEATTSLVKGETVTAGENFDIQHVNDLSESVAAKGVRLEEWPDAVVGEMQKAYKITGPAGELGQMLVTKMGDLAKIENIEVGEGPNALGGASVRSLLRQFRKLNPEIKELSGERISGARFGGQEVYEGEYVAFRLPGAEVRPGKTADYALAARADSPEALALAGEQHLRPETFAEVPDVERFDRMPGETEDAASYWDKRLEAASPEERQALGATDNQPTYQLQPIRNFSEVERNYDIIDKDGRRLGSVYATVEDGIARIDKIETSDGANSLGASATRSLLRQFREFNPEVKSLAGERISGARFGGQEVQYGEEISVGLHPARDLTPEQVTKLAADPATESAVLHNLEHIMADKPDMEFSTQIRQPDGSYTLETRKLSDVLAEIDGMETAGKELEACAAGLAMAAE